MKRHGGAFADVSPSPDVSSANHSVGLLSALATDTPSRVVFSMAHVAGF